MSCVENPLQSATSKTFKREKRDTDTDAARVYAVFATKICCSWCCWCLLISPDICKCTMDVFSLVCLRNETSEWMNEQVVCVPTTEEHELHTDCKWNYVIFYAYTHTHTFTPTIFTIERYNGINSSRKKRERNES